MTTGIAKFSAHIGLDGLADTQRLAAQIAAGLRPGCCVALRGELGAGKTTLARAILVELGVGEHVPSPSFTLVQNYETKLGEVFHFDLYRVKRPEELEELGLEDALDQGICLIEWPEHGANYIPLDALWVDLTMTPENARHATVQGPAVWTRHFPKDAKHD